MMQKSKIYFDPWETVLDGNPQKIVERGEAAELPPLLIMQGGADDNVIPEIQERFAATYCSAGGECQLEIFPGCSHMWVAEPGPATDRAHDIVKAFIARQLNREKVAA
jgi:alpha-beta hydrolase superfamily lysophospholipase